MYLHEEDYFKYIIATVSEKSGLSDVIVEKDYYVTLILKELIKHNNEIVFKGGTSLSKAFHLIDRFSEDIDITFKDHIGENKRKKLKYNVIKQVSDKLKMPIINWKQTESDKDYNQYKFSYETVLNNNTGIAPSIILETALMSSASPVETKEIDNYIFSYLKDSEFELLEKAELLPFAMNVQSLERTLIDKMFALCDYYLLNKPIRNSRHLYDIFKVYPAIKEDNAFKELVECVRLQRQEIGEKYAPSANANIDIIKVVESLYKTEFYKDDYDYITRRLIRETIDYRTVIDFYVFLMKRYFR